MREIEMWGMTANGKVQVRSSEVSGSKLTGAKVARCDSLRCHTADSTGLSEWPAVFGVNRKSSKASLSSHCSSLHFYRWDKPGTVTITTRLSILFFPWWEKGWESNKAGEEKKGSEKKKRSLSLTSHKQVYQFWFWCGWWRCVTRWGAAERGGSRKYSFSWQTQETETEVERLRNADTTTFIVLFSFFLWTRLL